MSCENRGIVVTPIRQIARDIRFARVMIIVLRFCGRILSRGSLFNKAASTPRLFHYNLPVHNRIVIMAGLLLAASCSGLSTLTPGALKQAEEKWMAANQTSYRLVVSMEGDRVERGEFEVDVDQGVVTSLRRNGQVVNPASGQDYSMDGLFKIIHEEMDLAEKPQLLGAPSGYTAYLMARFDGKTGRLQHYRRAVGGVSNSIDIEVLSFEPRTGTGR